MDDNTTPPAAPDALAQLREQIGAREPTATATDTDVDVAGDGPFAGGATGDELRTIIDDELAAARARVDELNAARARVDEHDPPPAVPERDADVEPQTALTDVYGAAKHAGTDEATEPAVVDEQIARPDPLATDLHAGTDEVTAPADVEQQIAGPAAA